MGLHRQHRPDGHSAAVLRHLRSEEHTSELQSRLHLVCRLLLEKKKINPQPVSEVPKQAFRAPKYSISILDNETLRLPTSSLLYPPYSCVLNSIITSGSVHQCGI